MVAILVRVAAAGVNDDTARVFLHRWADLTGASATESASALAGASADLRGIAGREELSTVNRWIRGLAETVSDSRRARLRGYFLGQPEPAVTSGRGPRGGRS